jgi:two-component system chemotaxis response regulator CheY
MDSEQEAKSILVVDDVSSIRAFIKLLLQDNYNVTEAANGEEGINLYKSGHFDLVVTDVFMPLKSGLELVVELKKEHPDAKIIVLSDGGKDNFSNDLEICEALGASWFLKKSLIKDELLGTINKILND